MKAVNLNISPEQAIRYAKVIGIVIGVVLILVFLKKGIQSIKNLFNFDTREENPTYDPNEYIEGVPFSENFNLDGIVAELHDTVTATLVVFRQDTRCTAYEKYMSLNHNEFIAVANAYYNLYNRTLRSDINKTFVSGCSFFGTNWEEKVLLRMDDLGIV